ncbi:hypothetical protein BDN72DRAFT_541371 [Pluteus cervinus]|uniref:Uncharacterized protein n=1 Tax=Pluteus cervinus TaxID=181527 RepID=A0ACD3A303_9AGAR|nr:hypothetical protein BDN72DRAFT_541371 [Pluteus cervinus]
MKKSREASSVRLTLDEISPVQSKFLTRSSMENDISSRSDANIIPMDGAAENCIRPPTASSGFVPHPLEPDSMIPIPAEVASALPCRVRYMDLIFLDVLPFPNRLARLTFIPDSWDAMTDLIDAGPPGINESVFVTGQPEIGKLCYLYYRLIKRLIHGQTTLLQDAFGMVYLIGRHVCCLSTSQLYELAGGHMETCSLCFLLLAFVVLEILPDNFS